MTRLLAVDIGGTGLRVAVLDADGTSLAVEHVGQGAIVTDGDRAEADPARWWHALIEGCNRLDGRAGDLLCGIAGIATCGVTRTQIFLGNDLQVLRPAIAFRDARARVQATAVLERDQAGAHPHARHLNAFHPLARLLWLAEHEPECWQATRLVIEPKDYLNLRLTGAAVSDAISQFWLASAYREMDGVVLARLAGLGKSVLPLLVAPTAEVGRVLGGLPGALARFEGLPVFCGSNDTWVAVAGIGGLVAGRAYNISGTSEVFGLMADAPCGAEGLITMAWGEDIWQIGGPGQNGADVLRWAMNRFAPGPEDTFRERVATILAGSASARPLIFLPFLHGERVPFWDQDLTGAFLGLRDGHGPADFVRAAMEGVAFLNRTVLARAEAAAGRRADEIRFSGGGARIAAWAQVKADIVNRPVVVPAVAEPGLRGCVAVARVGLGLSPTIEAAQGAIAAEAEQFRPDPRRARHYDELYAVFLRAHDAVAELSHSLSDLARFPVDPGTAQRM